MGNVKKFEPIKVLLTSSAPIWFVTIDLTKLERKHTQLKTCGAPGPADNILQHGQFPTWLFTQTILAKNHKSDYSLIG